MNGILANTVAALLLPPLNLFLLGGIGWLLKNRHPRLGKTLIFTSIALLWILSTPYIAFELIGRLESSAYAPPPPNCHPRAIVVLGAGTYPNAPEYGGDTVPALGLERLRLAAHLYKQTQLPILVAGGRPDNGKFSEAELMKSVLENDFKIPVKWVEDTSNNTRENALFSRQILQKAGIDSILLVTQAWHIPRARDIFAQTGLCVIPAGTAFRTHVGTPHHITLPSLLPTAEALQDSYTYLHEVIGLVWYQLRPLISKGDKS